MRFEQLVGAGVLTLCALGLVLWLTWEQGFRAGKRESRRQADALAAHMHEQLAKRLHRYAPHDGGRSR